MTDLEPLRAAAGANDIAYQDPNLPGHAMWLRSARPRRCTQATPILFVHHGVGRNGADYRDYWLPLVDEADLLVIVPEFPADSFHGSHWYNYGNRTHPDGRLKPRGEWTYGVDGRLFDALVAQGITHRPGYGVFGHSAGAQFVHRALSLGFRDRVLAAVSANAGTYAMPELDIEFPYGLGGTNSEETLLGLLGFPLAVMAGTADIDGHSPNFPKEPAAMRQGPTRYARAHRYVETARATAAHLNVPCAWTIADVVGVGHDGHRMSAAAAPLLATALHATNS